MALGTRRGAFTLAELIVAIGIFALMMTMVAMIFSVSSKAVSLSQANNEILNNLRAFETQIQKDFEGMRDDAFLGICYNTIVRQLDPDRPAMAATRADWIVFFADGKFESKNWWWDPVAGAWLPSSTVTAASPEARPETSTLARINYGIIGTHVYTNNNATAAAPLSSLDLGRMATLAVQDPIPGRDVMGANDPPPIIYNNATLSEDFKQTAGPLRPRYLFESYDVSFENLEEVNHPPYGWSSYDYYANGLIGWYSAPTGGQSRYNFWLGLGYLHMGASLGRFDYLRMIPGCVGFKIQRWAEQNPVNPKSPWTPRWWPEDGDTATPMGTADLFAPDAAGATINDLRDVDDELIWECFNGPSDLRTSYGGAGPGPYGAGDWPQNDSAAPPWPWISRTGSPLDAAGNTVMPNVWRIVPADFPKAFKITITLVDQNRRLRSESASAGTSLQPFVDSAGNPTPVRDIAPTVIDGAQTYTITIVRP